MNQITTQTFSETEQNTLKLFEAIKHKDEKTALALIDDGICIDMNEMTYLNPRIKITPLSYAVKMGLSSVALKLIKNGANIDVNYPGMYETLIQAAMNRCSKKVVITLIERGESIKNTDIKNEWLPDIQKARQTYQEKHRQDIQKQLNALIALSTTTNLWDRMETTDKENVIRALSKHLTLEEKRFLINQRNSKDNC